MTREQWLRYHRIYERKSYRIIREALRDSINVNWDNVNESTYELDVRLNIDREKIKEGYREMYFSIGLLHGKRTGRDIQRMIDREQKAFSLPSFTNIFRNLVAVFIETIAPTRILSVEQTMANYLVKIMADKLREGMTIREVSAYMDKMVKGRNFYKWQALRIARTETTAAANFGAIASAEDIGVEVEKEWMSAEDSRVRYKPKDQFDHRVMDGVRVGEYQEFIVPGPNGTSDYLMYPGDAIGRAGDVINCRCSVAIVPRRDSSGNLIYK